MRRRDFLKLSAATVTAPAADLNAGSMTSDNVQPGVGSSYLRLAVGRERAIKLEERLVKARLRDLDLRAEAFRRGDALITVNGDGLQPHLEAFMYEILEFVQVRVNADGFDLLHCPDRYVSQRQKVMQLHARMQACYSLYVKGDGTEKPRSEADGLQRARCPTGPERGL